MLFDNLLCLGSKFQRVGTATEKARVSAPEQITSEHQMNGALSALGAKNKSRCVGNILAIGYIILYRYSISNELYINIVKIINLYLIIAVSLIVIFFININIYI